MLIQGMLCTRCKKNRNPGSFHFKNKAAGVKNSWCKFCMQEHSRTHYADNPERYKKRARAHQLRCRALVKALVEQAKNKPCADCKQLFPACVMDFDHLDAEQKTMTIGSISHRTHTLAAVERVRQEILKCDVVCANCHRIRTHISRPYSSVGRMPAS